MSDTRPYPKILRTTESADHALREYAARTHLAPFEALILAIGLLRTKDEREAASERAYKFAALWHNLARKLWHRWRSGLWALAREQNAADGLRREVASAREATRRADAAVSELEQANRDLGLDVAALRKMHEAEKGAHERCAAEVERLTREVAKLGALKSAEVAPVIDRFKEAFGADIPQAPSGRAASQPCACALPDDLAPRLATIAARRGVAPDVMLSNVIKNGISKIQASDEYQDRQKAARARS